MVASKPSSSPELWRQLIATAQVVAGVMQGQSTTRLLPHVAPNLRPGVQALTFTVLRRWGTAQALRQQLARKAPPAPVNALLGTALALLSDPAPHYEAHTLVDQTVQAAKQQVSTKNQAAFINACLRRYLREEPVLRAAIANDPQATYNHPSWWVRKLQKDYPTHWASILEANNQAAPMALRVFHQRALERNASNALADIEKLAINSEAYWVPTWGHERALVMRQAKPVDQIPGFTDGWVSVQDAGAQMAAPLLLHGWAWLESVGNADRPLRILDACAAPGGKTAHLLELLHNHPSVHLTALDIDPERCRRIEDNLQRLALPTTGQTVRVVAANAGDINTWWDGELFDAVLLDAPCTASGIVRRHPDVRWLRRESDIAQLAQQQRNLLQALWPLVRPGGRLLYCTCSVFKAEGEDQIAAFLPHNTNAHRLHAPGHLTPTQAANLSDVSDNPTCEHDGFYYALLEKLET